MKFYAASVPRSVRAARLTHLRADAIIGLRSIPLAGGGFQVFDIVMQGEADFLRTKNYLAAPPMGATAQQGQASAPYVLREIKVVEAGDAAVAAAHFRREFGVA